MNPIQRGSRRSSNKMYTYDIHLQTSMQETVNPCNAGSLCWRDRKDVKNWGFQTRLSHARSATLQTTQAGNYPKQMFSGTFQQFGSSSQRRRFLESDGLKNDVISIAVGWKTNNCLCICDGRPYGEKLKVHYQIVYVQKLKNWKKCGIYQHSRTPWVQEDEHIFFDRCFRQCLATLSRVAGDKHGRFASGIRTFRNGFAVFSFVCDLMSGKVAMPRKTVRKKICLASTPTKNLVELFFWIKQI